MVRAHFFGISLVLLMILAMFPVAFAENNTTEINSTNDDIDDEQEDEKIEGETIEEVSSMDSGIGAEVRLLQLEKSITRNILIGEQVVALVKEKGKDASELEELLNELEALKLEVKALDPNAENAVEDFVSIKRESLEVSKEFRVAARALLESEDRLALAKKIKDADKEALKDYNMQIRAKVHELNAEIVLKIFESLEIENDDLLAKIRNGEAKSGEVREAIKAAIQSMTPEERKDAWEKLKSSEIKKDTATRMKIEKARLRINERKEKRVEWLTKASEKIKDEDRKLRVQGALQKRADILDNRTERINERLEKMQTMRKNIREKTGGGAP